MSSKSDMYDKYGDIIPDGYTVSDKTKEMLNKPSADWSIPDSLDYKSPIELIAGNLQTQIENDAVKVVQSYGFNVDKAELEKALKYDRDQYDKGYADARMKYERPTGHWREFYDCINCSECDYTWRHFKTDFCPTCGADMRGGRE